MKSPGVIYRRYRQLKKKLLYEKIVESKRKCFDNCSYGQQFVVCGIGMSGGTVLNICKYNQVESLVPELCTCAVECSAFANKWSKEKVVDQFNKELGDWTTRVKLYPDLVALEWVLDKDLTDAIKNPNILNRVIVGIIMILEGLLKKVNMFSPKAHSTETKVQD